MARTTMTKLLMSIIVTMMLIQLALAVDHTVGGPNGGWDTSTDLRSWASSQTFTVGDNIVFRYTPNHNVFEVSKDDYDSCSTSSAISTDALSPTTISVSDAGSRYFICGTPGHCGQGMKVEIKTESTSSPPPTTMPSPPPQQSTPSPPPRQSTPSPPSSSPATPPPSSLATPPSSSPNTPPPPASTTPKTPEQPSPSPSSGETTKMSVVSMVGFGFLMMI